MAEPSEETVTPPIVLPGEELVQDDLGAYAGGMVRRSAARKMKMGNGGCCITQKK